ncbi:unnamed protein product [Rhizoctonia solani]|uniref:CFEM domain-containing protein n=1 Tax=Rhizoctonia solani TaxID=456999 RepID=A0A8H3B384_9AGAM|nr:unnamed protein product [Rhizoctonia solani]
MSLVGLRVCIVAFSLSSITMKSVFAFAALFAAYAAAQTPTSAAAPPISTGDISPCVLTCSIQAATTAGCTGITDVECLCGSAEFQQAALTCLQSQCPDEVASATALQSQLCGASGSGSSTAATASETGSASETESDTEVTGTSTLATGTASSSTTRTATIPATTSTTRPVTTPSSTRSATATTNASGTPTSATNSAGAPFNFAATGVWAAAALGGAVVAQLVL